MLPSTIKPTSSPGTTEIHIPPKRPNQVINSCAVEDQSQSIPSSRKERSVESPSLLPPDCQPTHQRQAEMLPSKSKQALSTLIIIFVVLLLLFFGYLLSDSIQMILVVLENQNDGIIIAILTVLYAVVSMPFAWGYIIINVTTGYLFGIVKGLLVTVVTATPGIVIAHYLIKTCLPVQVRQWIISSNKVTESLSVVMSTSKEQAFKIVVLCRLTPVPFGLQNAFFAVNNAGMSTLKYLEATCMGLLPCQILNVYLGSTFRSMEQLLSGSDKARLAIAFLLAQVMITIAVTVFIVRRARMELGARIVANASSKSSEENSKELNKNILMETI